MLEDRKVGGILVEAERRIVTIGLGVNLWWPDPIEGAAALLAADPGPEAAGWIAEQWADRLIERLASGPRQWGRDEYPGLCSTLGRADHVATRWRGHRHRHRRRWGTGRRRRPRARWCCGPARSPRSVPPAERISHADACSITLGACTIHSRSHD